MAMQNEVGGVTPDMLERYRLRVFQSLDQVEMALQPFVSNFKHQLRTNPAAIEAVFTVVGVVVVVVLLLKALLLARRTQKTGTGKQLASLRGEVEKARGQLNNLRKLMQERVPGADKRVPGGTSKIVEELNQRIKQRDELIAKQAEGLQACSKFNQNFLPKFESVMSQLAEIRGRLGKGSHKSSSKPKSTLEESRDLSGIGPQTRQSHLTDNYVSRPEEREERPILNGINSSYISVPEVPRVHHERPVHKPSHPEKVHEAPKTLDAPKAPIVPAPPAPKESESKPQIRKQPPPPVHNRSGIPPRQLPTQPPQIKQQPPKLEQHTDSKPAPQKIAEKVEVKPEVKPEPAPAKLLPPTTNIVKVEPPLKTAPAVSTSTLETKQAVEIKPPVQPPISMAPVPQASEKALPPASIPRAPPARPGGPPRGPPQPGRTIKPPVPQKKPVQILAEVETFSPEPTQQALQPTEQITPPIEIKQEPKQIPTTVPPPDINLLEDLSSTTELPAPTLGTQPEPTPLPEPEVVVVQLPKPKMIPPPPPGRRVPPPPIRK